MKLLTTIGAALLLGVGLAASGHAMPGSSTLGAQSADTVIQAQAKKKKKVAKKKTMKRKARKGSAARANPTGRDPNAGGPMPKN